MQVAFVGHDAGHNAVAHISKYDGYIGLVVNACIGIGPSWWKVSFCATGTLMVFLRSAVYSLMSVPVSLLLPLKSVVTFEVTKVFSEVLVKCMTRRS
jgi:hypothetical protein